MHRLGWIGLLLVLVIGVDAQPVQLSADNVQLEFRLDAYGIETQVITGEITNHTNDAFTNITVFADLLNGSGAVIGEGLGFVVDACGTALIDDALQPQDSGRFLATVDLFEDDRIADIEVVIEGTAVEAVPRPEFNLVAVTQVSDEEVVAVEWLDADTLRYGVGCDTRVFTTYDWYQYQMDSDTAMVVDEHPYVSHITDAFIQQTGINQLTQTREDDLTLFDRSFLTFAPTSSRIVYQTDLRTIVTAEQDGSFKRVVHQQLHQYSLQGFIWTPPGNFLAYYFGAYGEPVRYFTAASNGGLISAFLPNNTASVTVPGVVDDARNVIIGGTFADTSGSDVTGYWLSSVITQQRELLFTVDTLPGNNYPAPAYYRKDDSTRYIYVIRPIDGSVMLQCYFREGNALHTLTELPLVLDNDERAWSWFAPDFNTLAIGANGSHSGLWLVDLSAFDVCR